MNEDTPQEHNEQAQNPKPNVAKIGRKRHWRNAFLDAFKRMGIVAPAAKLAGVSRHAVRMLAQRDAQFASDYADALEESTQWLEAQARKMATDPIRPSEGMLKFILAARRPEVYRDRQDIRHTGAEGGPIAVTVSQTALAEMSDALEKRTIQRIEARKRFGLNGNANGNVNGNGTHHANGG